MSEQETEYRYDVFISYRHTPLDRAWAKWLVESLEGYTVPTGLIEKGAKAGIERVFRDEDELPSSANLGPQLKQALRQSRYLIVICTKSTPESQWVNAEVQTFRDLGRHERILALLVDGEPKESFPEALGHIKETVTDPDGTTRVQMTEVEPLAADVRPRADESEKVQKEKALLRIIATLIGVKYDDLWQRHARRAAKKRRILALAALATLFLIASSVYLYVTNMAAEKAKTEVALGQVQAEQLKTQSALLEAQAQTLLAKARLQRMRNKPHQAVALFTAALESTMHTKQEVPVWNELMALASTVETSKVLTGHTKMIRRVAFDQSGEWLASASDDETARLWDLKTGLSTPMIGHQKQLVDLSFNLTGDALITSSLDGSVRRWSLPTVYEESEARQPGPPGLLSGVLDVAYGAKGMIYAATQAGFAYSWNPVTGEKNLYRGHTHSIGELAVSPDADRLFTVSRDMTAKVWDTEKGSIVKTLSTYPDSLVGVKHCPSRPLVALRSLKNKFTLWNTKSGHVQEVLAAHKTRLTRFAFSPNGELLASGSEDGSVKLWSIPQAVARHEMKGHTNKINGLAFSPDGTVLASVAADATARIWDVARGQVVNVLHGHDQRIRTVAHHPKKPSIATGSFDTSVRLWSIKNPMLKTTLYGHKRGVTRAAYRRDGKRLLTGSFDGTARLWNAQTNKLILKFDKAWGTSKKAVQKTVIAARFNPQQPQVLIATPSNLALWPLQVGESPIELALPTKEKLRSAVYSPNGKRVLASFEKGFLSLWEARTGRLVQKFEGHIDDIPFANFGPRGLRILSTSEGEDKRVLIWDAKSGKIVHELVGAQSSIWHAAFSPNGRGVVAGQQNGTVILWELQKGTPRLLKEHTGAIWHVAFSPNGQTIASVSEDASARLWDRQTGKLIQTLKGHDKKLIDCEFSKDGKTLLTASIDHTARLWDVATGRLLQVFSGHKDLVWQASFSPDQRHVLTASGQPRKDPEQESADSTAKIWSIRPISTKKGLLKHAGKLTNYRVCKDTLDVVAVLPFPRPETVWVEETNPALCQKPTK